MAPSYTTVSISWQKAGIAADVWYAPGGDFAKRRPVEHLLVPWDQVPDDMRAGTAAVLLKLAEALGDY
jgi:hypothetical protein